MVDTYPVQYKEYEISFKIKAMEQRRYKKSACKFPTGSVPTGNNVGGWANILRCGLGRDGLGPDGRYGDRNPSIWFKSRTRQMLVTSAINGNKNYW